VTTLHVVNMRGGYVSLVNRVQQGRVAEPRGIRTYEISPCQVLVRDARDSVPVGVRPGLRLEIGAAETVQLIAGISDAKQLMTITPNFQPFVRHHRLPGAYGPRIGPQMYNVIQRITQDPDTRQAVATVWRSNELEDEDNPDLPCTLEFMWLLRDGYLEQYTMMRSNDVFLGVPYDFMAMTRLQMALAWTLGVGVGPYHHYAVSMHLYERDIIALDRIDYATPNQPIELVPPFIEFGNDTRPGMRDTDAAWSRWRRVVTWARKCVVDSGDPDKLPESALWYFNILRSYRSHNLLCSACGYVLPEECFHPSTRHVSDWRSVCIECKRARRQTRIDGDPDFRLRSRCQHHGITVDQYKQMLADQEGKCAICREVPDHGRWMDFVIDHNHTTGRVRGLLCTNCNFGLGHFDDSIERMTTAAMYIAKETS
jgi:hypothetical protein